MNIKIPFPTRKKQSGKDQKQQHIFFQSIFTHAASLSLVLWWHTSLHRLPRGIILDLSHLKTFQLFRSIITEDHPLASLLAYNSYTRVTLGYTSWYSRTNW